MEGLCFCLVLVLGVVSCSQYWTPGSALELTVRSGDNITLYCDCKSSPGVNIVWFRNCSHENQPSLVLRTSTDLRVDNIKSEEEYLNPLPRYQFVRNSSSESYDLHIENISGSDEGLYYCGTQQFMVFGNEKITFLDVYRYGNGTRILLSSTEPHYHPSPPPPDCRVCWMLMVALCPAVAVLSSLLSSLLVYHLCQKKVNVNPVVDKPHDTSSPTRMNQDGDVCYAALEIRQASQRPKKKKNVRSCDFSTYAAINTSRM